MTLAQQLLPFPPAEMSQWPDPPAITAPAVQPAEPPMPTPSDQYFLDDQVVVVLEQKGCVVHASGPTRDAANARAHSMIQQLQALRS